MLPGKIRTTETTTGEEFVRRFMLHIVPKSIHRVRYGGIFHGKWREPRLDRCRELLIEYNEKNDIHYYSSAAARSAPVSTPPATDQQQTEPQSLEPRQTEPQPAEPKQAERNLPKCARCKTPEMQSLGFQDKTTTRAIIANAQRVIVLVPVSWTTREDWSLYFSKELSNQKRDSRNPTDLVRVRSTPTAASVGSYACNAKTTLQNDAKPENRSE